MKNSVLYTGMGLYSRIEHQCECGEWLEFQTKCGPEEYGIYCIDRVPIEAARDLDGDMVYCKLCETTYEIKVSPMNIGTVQMEVVKR